MSSAGGGGAQDELVLLEKVLMRLATADTDEALTAAVNKFLPPCLLKLTSHQEGVRKKVMELLVHINKRIKSNPKILLPLDALLVQYQDPAATSFVTNFTIIYIKMGFPRLSPEKQAELVPAVLSCIDGKPSSHQESLLLMILPVLGSIVPPDNPEKKKLFLGLNERPQTCQIFISFLLDYLLLPYGSHPSLRPADDQEDPEVTSARMHSGLSETAWKRVAGEVPVKAEELEKTKVKVVKFLGMGLLDEMEVALHLIIGTADSRHSVVSQAESEMRKFSSVLDWNNQALVSGIYSLFLGTLVLKEKPPPKPENKRVPANTRIRLKLMPYLLKSREAAVQFPACIQVIFDLLFGTTGNTNAKLKLMAVSFIHHVIFHCPGQRLGAIGAVLLSALTRLVAEEGDNPKLRASCYVAIGKLGLKVPQLVNKDITMIQTFFEAMSREDKETQMSVQEAMSLMAPSFRQMERGNLGFVEAMLATYIEKDEPQVRLVAVQYAGEIFQQTHEASRYILLLGAGDTKEEVANQAKGHLYRTLNKLRQQQSEFRFKRPKDEEVVNKDEMLPGFVSMLRYVLDKAGIRIKTQERFVVGDKILAFNPSVYTEMLNFLRVCLMNSAGILPTTESLNQPDFGAPAITRYLSSVQEKHLVLKFLEFAETFLRATVAAPQANAMLQIVGCTLRTTARAFTGKIGFFKGLLDNTKEEIRETVASLYSIVAGEMDSGDFEKAITELTRSFKEKSLEFQHGIVVTLGHSYGRKVLHERISGKSNRDFRDWESYRTNTELILAQLSHPQALMIGAACYALSEIGRCGPLPLPSEDEDNKSSKIGVVKKLLALLKNGKTNIRVREKAALALGQLCIGDVEFPHRKLVLQEFLESAQEIKDIELHFTMGEALVYATLGPLSPMGRELWSTNEEDFRPLAASDASDSFVDWVLDELCNKYTMSTHPNVKQASCLWLLAVTKYGKELPRLKSRLLEIQSAFMSLLGDNNDLVQDAASKGLGLVYDSSTEQQQEEMVGSLLRTLTEGKREVQKVNEDTKIFEEGQIGKAPTGENLSTYKELCSLATDLNQPDLVYKFMHLANYNAMWNSRKGAAFGFSSIAAKAGEQMEPHLPKIVPKLYRYQFDPTPKIQESMASIWSALVPETNKTVDKYLPQILDEIIGNLTSNQWRVRESCCMALQDLLRGRTLDDAIEKLPELWVNVFRVMDDIKESVRGAAAKAADTLSRACIKMCDPNQGAKSSEAAVRAVMPPLLETGLHSTVPEVRAIVINTIVKVTKNAGGQLKPHLPLLIPALLEATSEMEPKDINYLSVRMANDPSIQEKLDLARITAAKSSPMMECINYVLQYVDADTLEKLVPRLIDLIKGNFGLGTKGTAAHLVTTLTHQCPLDLQPHTGRILAAFVAGLTDRNAAVRKTYASAIGHLIKTAKDSSMEKLFFKLRTWYLEKDDEASKHAVAYTFEAINMYNPDRIKSHAAQAMPLAFLAMHEAKQVNNDGGMTTVDIWEEVWSDGTPGTEGGVRLYLREIMSLLTAAIDSSQWKVKSQVARAMGTVAEKLGDAIPEREQRELLVILVNALSGRTWDGKEAVLVALADVCSSGKAGVGGILKANTNDLSAEKLAACLFRECGKDVHQYKLAAVLATGRIVRDLELPCFEQLFELVFPWIKKEEEEKENGKDDKEEEETREDGEKALDLQHAVYECLGQAWPAATSSLQEKHLVPLLKTLRVRVQATTRKNQLCIAKCLNNIISGLNVISDPKLREDLFVEAAKILSAALSVPKNAQLRTEALSVLGRAMKLLAESQCPEQVFLFREEIGKSIDDVIKDVSSDAATKSAARELKASLLAMPAVDPNGAPMEEELPG